MSDGKPGWGKPAAIVTIVASIYFAAAAIATHLVNPQYSFVADYISDYAVGPNGWIYGSAFLASCLGCLALAIALWSLEPRPALSRRGAVLLVLVGISYAVDFVFPTDILAPGQPPQTTIGLVHFIDALIGWVLFVVAAFLITARLRHDAAFSRWRGALLGLAWLSAILLAALVVVVASRMPFGGLAEKAFIVGRNVWVLIVALVLLNAPQRISHRAVLTPPEREML